VWSGYGRTVVKAGLKGAATSGSNVIPAKAGISRWTGDAAVRVRQDREIPALAAMTDFAAA
jgi:hypothetical protein